MAAAEALFGASLRLHPRAFRAQWGDAMRQAFRDRCREVARGERGVLALFAESLPDLAASAAREQVQVAGVAPPLRRHLAFALLLGFAATAWWRQPIAQALVFSGEAASARWPRTGNGSWTTGNSASPHGAPRWFAPGTRTTCMAKPTLSGA
jgi:hypothetical protein